jgi:hypothetical protein
MFYMNIKLDSWMTCMYETLKYKTINNIILPGTHNSATYKFDFNNSFIWNNSFVKKIKPFRDICCVKNIAINWSKCQQMTIFEQLCNGVRIFDFKISYDNINNIYYITHTFTCVKLIDVLNDIIKFMKIDNKEIIIIICKPDWDNINTMYNVSDDFTNNIIAYLGNYLFANINVFPTVEQMIICKKRIIFSYEYATDTLLWDDLLFNLPWTNTSNVKSKLEGLNNSLLSFKEGYHNTLDCFLTPQTSDVAKSIFKSIFICGCCVQNKCLYELANKFKKQLNNFIYNNKQNFKYLSGIFFDYIDNTIISTVIEINNT